MSDYLTRSFMAPIPKSFSKDPNFDRRHLIRRHLRNTRKNTVFEVFVVDSPWGSMTPPTPTLMYDANSFEPQPFLGSGPQFGNKGSIGHKGRTSLQCIDVLIAGPPPSV